MNDERRKAIKPIKAEIMAFLGPINVPQMDEWKTGLEAARDEEQDYFDNMAESLQEGEKGEKAQEAIEALSEALELVEGLLDAVNAASEIDGNLDTALA